MLKTGFDPGTRIGTERYARTIENLDRLTEDMHAAYRLGFDITVCTERHRLLDGPDRQLETFWTLTIYEPVVFDDATGHPEVKEAVSP